MGTLFRGEAGLAVQSDGAWGQNPVLRGLKKEGIVVLIDGVRVNSAQPQGAIASFLGLGLLDRAEVVKGPTSVLYGSGAMGGVVNLITPEAGFSKERTTSGRFGLTASTVDNGFAGAAILTHSSTDQALVVGAAANDVGDYDAPDGRAERTGYRSESLLAKYRHRLADKASVRVNVQFHRDRDVWYPGSARTGGQPGGAGIPPPLGTVTIHSPEQRREFYEVGTDATIGPGKFSAEVYRQDVFRQIRAWSSTLQRDYVRNDVTFATDGGRARYLVPIGGGHLLTIGAESWRQQADPERYIDSNPPAFDNNARNDPFSDGRIRSLGLFVQDEFEIGRTRFVAGARFDRIDGDAAQKGAGAAVQTTGLAHTDDNLSWSLGAIHPLTRTLSAYANVGRAYRAADMRERYEDSARGDGYYHTGNPQLAPERSTSFEAGLKGRDRAVEYRMAAFYTRIDNFIAGRVTGTTHPGSGLPLKRTENVEKVALFGFEGWASAPVGAVVADASFTWLRGDNEQDDEPLAQVPPPELRMGIGQPAERGFYWRAQVRAVSKQDRVATKFTAGNENATSGFATVDAGLGWRFARTAYASSSSIDLRLNNLLDKGYHEHLAEGISGKELQAPGRGVTLSLNATF
ncbi:MAG: TonB-dependent receptor [Burkholderiales bacterium]|nr:TonB-dependent receptor [Burkholderiales bacterium]